MVVIAAWAQRNKFYHAKAYKFLFVKRKTGLIAPFFICKLFYSASLREKQAD